MSEGASSAAAKLTRIGVLGAGGRMGAEIIAAVAADPRLRLAGAVERAGSPAIGSPLPGGLAICTNSSALAHNCDVFIDFTTPAALAGNLESACLGGCAIVVGTTGLGAADHAALDVAARSIAVLLAANTSLGVAMLGALVEQAAARLGEDWDIEIAELHHRHKRDAPSGTALLLGEAAARGRGVGLGVVMVSGDRGGERIPGAIGFASLRGGSAAGDHTVLLLGDGERLELTHRAESREVFASGAVRAAAWLAGRAPGRYTMAQVLGF